MPKHSVLKENYFLDRYVVKNGERLRTGYTTGTTATVATVAAAKMLLTGEAIYEARVSLPQGEEALLEVKNCCIHETCCTAIVLKDGGDDPDITHGTEIHATVKLISEGIEIRGGKGVGTVTTEGMRCPKGEAAINPVPRKMIIENLNNLAKELEYRGGFSVTISVPDGEALAKQTYNPRLGIVGGISILGTTGIVWPMSEKALIDTIKVELDRKYADNPEYVIISPGNYGQDYCQNNLGIDINEAVKISNFLGDSLDYIAYKGFKRVLLVGHTGKLVKIAGGIMNTHSSYGDCRMEIISAYSALLGADSETVDNILNCVTTDQAMDIIKEKEYYSSLKKKLAERVKYHLNFRLKGKAEIEFIMFTTDKRHTMESSNFRTFLKSFKTIEKDDNEGR